MRERGEKWWKDEEAGGLQRVRGREMRNTKKRSERKKGKKEGEKAISR